MKSPIPPNRHSELLSQVAALSGKPRSINDRERMVRFICLRIPPTGIRIELSSGGDDGPPDSAYLTPIEASSDDPPELEIEANADWITLRDVYDYFRFREMSYAEWWKEFTWLDPINEFDRKVRLLSKKERKIFNAVDEHVPQRGEKITAGANVEHDGQAKGTLSWLVKIGLLRKARGGYLKATPPSPLRNREKCDQRRKSQD
jgi:hypothetical protein